MRVTFMPENITCDVNKDVTILEAAIDNNIFIGDNICGQKKCGNCKVIVSKGNDNELTTTEKDILTKEEIDKGVRLACCYRIKNDISIICISKKNQSMVNMEENMYNDKEDKSEIEDNEYAVIIDIGTTTIKTALYDIKTKRIVTTYNQKNPQTVVGADVISRISYTMTNKHGKDKLNNLITEAVNKVIVYYYKQIINYRKNNKMLKLYVDMQDIIKSIVVVGNTTMINLFMNYEVVSLGVAPFEGKYKAGEITSFLVKPDNISNQQKEIQLILPQIIAGHVGSDAYACMVEMDYFDRQDRSLIIDFGTNGEMILNNKGKISVCSTAAGPAFEGIRGMKGSMIIEYIADLLELNIIEKDGHMHSIKKTILCERKSTDNIYKVYENVRQEDIRNVQLAKASISAAYETLLIENNLSTDELDNIYIAGEFGDSIDIRKAMRIGLLPDIDEIKIIQMGNSALDGAIRIFESKNTKLSKANLANITHYELAELDTFNKLFIDKIDF